jgi:glutamate/tyrosine decarboxylase-like PLP-dependent enzyme
MTHLLAKFIDDDENFFLLAPVHLNTVCFTLKGKEKCPEKFLKKFNKKGKVFMTSTTFNNQSAIRAAFVNWRTEEKDVNIAIKQMRACT